MSGAFDGGKPVVSDEGPLAKIFENVYTHPADTFKALSEKASTWHDFILRGRG